MLLAEGVSMRSMESDDWAFLISLCDESVQRDYARRGEPDFPFSPLQLWLRERMDSYLAGYIADWSVHRASDEDGWTGAEGGGGNMGTRDFPRRARLVRLQLSPCAAHLKVLLSVDAASAAVRLALVPVAAHVAANVAPVPRFRRTNGTTSAAGTFGGGVGGSRGRSGGADMVKTSGWRVSLGLRSTQGRLCIALLPAGRSRVVLQVQAEAPRVQASLLVVAANAFAGANENEKLGLLYAKGPDGTRGFGGRGRGRRLIEGSAADGAV